MSVMKHSPTFPPPPYPPRKIIQKNVQYAHRSVHVHDIKGFSGCLSGSLQKTVPVVKLDFLSFSLFQKKYFCFQNTNALKQFLGQHTDALKLQELIGYVVFFFFFFPNVLQSPAHRLEQITACCLGNEATDYSLIHSQPSRCRTSLEQQTFLALFL